MPFIFVSHHLGYIKFRVLCRFSVIKVLFNCHWELDFNHVSWFNCDIIYLKDIYFKRIHFYGLWCCFSPPGCSADNPKVPLPPMPNSPLASFLSPPSENSASKSELSYYCCCEDLIPSPSVDIVSFYVKLKSPFPTPPLPTTPVNFLE